MMSNGCWSVICKIVKAPQTNTNSCHVVSRVFCGCTYTQNGGVEQGKPIVLFGLLVSPLNPTTSGCRLNTQITTVLFEVDMR